MTHSGSEIQTKQRARAEAASWIALLHGSRRTPAMEKSWRAWLEASPENAAAWELATEVYTGTSDFPATLPTPPETGPESRIPWRTVATVSLSVLIAVMVVVAVGWDHYWKGSHSFTTALGERRTVILEDGTRVELNTSSRLVVQYNSRVRAVTLETGEADFKVSPDPHRPFVVAAGSHSVLALGTEFVVQREAVDDTSVSVTLIEGKVAVVPAQSARALPTGAVAAAAGAQTLLPGQRWRLKNNVVLGIERAAIDQETAWMQGRLIFDSTPLSEAVEQFNRYNTEKLRVGPGVSDSIRIGGTFVNTDPENFARSVEAQYGLRLDRDAQGLVLEASPP